MNTDRQTHNTAPPLYMHAGNESDKRYTRYHVKRKKSTGLREKLVMEVICLVIRKGKLNSFVHRCCCCIKHCTDGVKVDKARFVEV